MMIGEPGINLQPAGDPRPEEIERSPGKNCSHWILSDLVGSEQPGVERRRSDQSESLKLTQLYTHNLVYSYLYNLNHDLYSFVQKP